MSRTLLVNAPKINLIDASSGAWGHINFDDLNGDIECEQI